MCRVPPTRQHPCSHDDRGASLCRLSRPWVSYRGSLGFGFNADREVVPDVDVFATSLAKGSTEVTTAAAVR